MAKQSNSKKIVYPDGTCIAGCNPQCPYFPNQEGEVSWHIGEDGLKHRDNPLLRCCYNGSPITSWNRICPWKEDKKNLLLEKEKQETAEKASKIVVENHEKAKKNSIKKKKKNRKNNNLKNNKS